MVRGFANLKCTFFHKSNGDSIVEYKVVMITEITSYHLIGTK
jgi:hypothetical protein